MIKKCIIFRKNFAFNLIFLILFESNFFILLNFSIKSLVSLLLNAIPLLSSIDNISFGPLEQSLENTNASENIASINTKPGSSHSEDKINNLQFDKYL